MELKIQKRKKSRKILLVTCLILGLFILYNYSKYNGFKNMQSEITETIEKNRLEINPSMSIIGNMVESKLYPSGGTLENEIYFTNITPTIDLNVKYETSAAKPIDVKGNLNIVLFLESEDQWTHEIELIKDKKFESKNTLTATIIDEKIEVNVVDLQSWIDSVEEEIGIGQSRYNWTFKSIIRGESTYGDESKAFEFLAEKHIEDTGETIEILDENSTKSEKIVFESEIEKEMVVDYLGEKTTSQAASLSLILTIVALIVEICCAILYFKIRPDKNIKIDNHVRRILNKAIELNGGFGNYRNIIWISCAKTFVELIERRELEIFLIKSGSGKKYFAMEEGAIYGYCIDELFDEGEFTEKHSKII